MIPLSPCHVMAKRTTNLPCCVSGTIVIDWKRGCLKTHHRPSDTNGTMPQFISDKPSSVACCHVENQPHPTGIDPSQPAQPAGTLKLEGLSTRKDSIALVDAAPPAPWTKDDGHAAHVECVGCFPEKERCAAGPFKGTRKFNIQVVFTLYCFKLKR